MIKEYLWKQGSLETRTFLVVTSPLAHIAEQLNQANLMKQLGYELIDIKFHGDCHPIDDDDTTDMDEKVHFF